MEEQDRWIVIFATLLGMERHPGNLNHREGRMPLSVSEVANLTDLALTEWNKRYANPEKAEGLHRIRNRTDR